MRIVLFDADGVLTLPEEFFSAVYARLHGLDPEPFEQFFRNDWRPFVTGKADLRDSIVANPKLWQWKGDVDSLLNFWFETEDVRNEDLLSLIREIRANDMPCFLATEQEKYRGEYMREVMFKDSLDGCYVTAELGASKAEPAFFQAIVEDLQTKYSEIEPKDITFFDDSESKVSTARSVGMNGQLYTSVEQVRSIVLG